MTTLLYDKVLDGMVETLYEDWASRKGQKVPETDDIALKNGAVKLDATYLYADMAGSTRLAQTFTAPLAARVLKAYIRTACIVLRETGGIIKSFDGDRVMAIYHGDDMVDHAIKAAFNINWVVHKMLGPELQDIRPALKDNGWTLGHGIGIDMGQAFIVRGGVRDHNDLISVGGAPNIAAKLSDERVSGMSIHITQAVWDSASYDYCFDDGPPIQRFWSDPRTMEIGDKRVSVRGSGRMRRP